MACGFPGRHLLSLGGATALVIPAEVIAADWYLKCERHFAGQDRDERHGQHRNFY